MLDCPAVDVPYVVRLMPHKKCRPARRQKKDFMKTPYWGFALLAATGALTGPAQAQISLSIVVAPPALPIYAQPAMPGDGYLWTPGYWSWSAGDGDYYWVPGTLVSAPFVGALWTPGYWGSAEGGYVWHGGYWGSHIGYYGGINYGYGYVGVGYQGGYWNNGAFSYNRSANNVGNVHVHNVYNTRIENTTVNRVSFNGGVGGIRLQPTKSEESIANMPHNGQTPMQLQHEQASRNNPDLRASVNHGMPRIAATPEPGAFKASGVVAARAAQIHPVNKAPGGPASRPQAQQAHTEHAHPAAGGAQHPPAQHPPAQHTPAQHPPARHEDEHHEKSSN